MNFDVVILAGGEGKRTGLAYNKVHYQIRGRSLLSYALHPFLHDERINQIILVAHPHDISGLEAFYRSDKITITAGGTTRSDSVQNGLEKVTSPYVLIHDGARPNLSHQVIERVLDALKTQEAAVPAVPIYDTVKKIEKNRITEAVDRNHLYRIQTPQGFLSETIKTLYRDKKTKATDNCDITFYEKTTNRHACIVMGDILNIKITDIHDIKAMEMILDG